MSVPRLDAADAAQLARGLFGIEGECTPLPSERDQNFLVRTAAGVRHVLKIANAAEDRAVLDLQHAAMRHARARARGLELPCALAARDGSEIVTPAAGPAAGHMVRMFGWLEGEPLARVARCDAELLASLGTAMAQLDLALAGFSHPAMRRELHWDVRHAAQALRHLPLLGDAEQAIVRALMRAFDEVPWDKLRFQVIHGDANDYNVMVREGRVVGLLDFGDMVHSALACDLAVALAYAMLDKPDPLAAASAVIAAYAAVNPLTSPEREHLYALATARLCLSVCHAAHNVRVKSDDPYQQVTAAPAWRLLRLLAALPPQAGRDAFSAAGGSR